MQKGQRYNIYLNDNIANKIDAIAQEMGISRSATISMMATQYVNGINAIQTLQNITPLLKEVQQNGKE